MDMDPQQAQDIIDSNTKSGDNSTVITTPTSWADTLTQGVMSGVQSVMDNVAGALPSNSIIDELRKLGLSDTQIASLLGSGGGGSSGGGGFSAPSFHDQQMAAYKQQLANTYFQLWGKPAPDSVINAAYNQGLNVFQFEDQIRQDPSFKHTETYQNEMADNAVSLARMLGVLPG